MSHLTSSQLLAATLHHDPGAAVSLSQPVAEHFRHRAIAVPRVLTQGERPAGLPLALNANHANTGLRDQVFAEVQARLRDASIDISGTDARLFSFMLPTNGADPNDWNDLINNPIFLSPDRVRCMFSMTPSNMDSRRTANDTRVFYCRTFTFTLHEFNDLVQLLLDAFGDHIPDQVFAWEALATALDSQTDSDVLVYVRYIGTTNGTSWQRYMTDLTSGLVQGLHRIFYEICHSEFPDVLANAEVEEFDRAIIEMALRCARQRLANDREQALIALFGPSTLLNAAVGGFAAEMVFDATDDQDFLNLQTRVIDSLQIHPTGTSDLTAVHNYGLAVQRHATNNPISTNSAAFPITDEVRDMIISQANAACIDNNAVLVTIGSDLGQHGTQDISPFFSGSGRSGALMVSTLQHLTNLELGFSTTAQYQIPNLQKQMFFPFVDLYPWTKKSKTDLPDALILLRHYLQTTSPVIVTTLSEHVASVALGKFHHDNGLSRGDTIGSICGKVFVIKYDDDIAANDDNCVSILIPLIHPGGIAHAGDNKLYMRLFTRSLSVAWLAMHLALQIMAQGRQSKKEVCRDVLKALKAKVGPGTKFHDNFEKLRSDYRKFQNEYYQRTRTLVKTRTERQAERTDQCAKASNQDNLLMAPKVRSEVATAGGSVVSRRIQPKISVTTARAGSKPQVQAAVSRCRKGLNELYLIIDCDIAHGSAISDERAVQVARLNGAFRQVLNVNSKSVSEFEKELEAVNTGDLYYFALTGTDQHVFDLPHLLSFFSGASDYEVTDTWLEDENAVRQAVAKLHEFIKKNVLTANGRRQDCLNNIPRSFEDYLITARPDLASYLQKLKPTEKVSMTVYQKSPHKVTIVRDAGQHDRHSGKLHFKWMHEQSETTIKDLRLPASTVPIVPGEERYISFVKEGVNITDASGRSLGVYFHRTVTLLLDHLITELIDHPLKNEFLTLWERETGLTVAGALQTDAGTQAGTEISTTVTSYAYPASFFSGESYGLPVTAKGSGEVEKVKKIREEQCPFQPASVGWLLDRFLRKYYPAGGEIDLGSPEVWPESDSVWTKLRTFVLDPLYTHHPHRDTLLASCSGIKDVGKSGGGAGQKGKGFAIVAGFVRLAKVLRPPVTQRAKEEKIRAENRRRTKSLLTVGALAPPNTVATVLDPELEAIVSEITVENDMTGIDDDAEEDSLEVIHLEAEQAHNSQAHASKLVKISQKQKTSDTPDKSTSLAQVPKPPNPATSKPRKRARDESSASTESKTVRFGDVRHLRHDFLIHCSNKYGWDYKRADSDDEVEIEEEATQGTKRQKTAGKRQQAKDAENPDDEMLLW